MQDVLAARWRVVVMRGGVAGLFGLLALLTPGLTLGVLVSLFGLYALVDAALALRIGWSSGATRGGDSGPFGRLLLFEGGVGAAAAVLVLLWPGITAFVLLCVVAVRALGVGGLQLAQAFALRRAAQGEPLLDVAGVVSLLFGCALLLLPTVAARGVLWWLVLYAIVSAALLATLGMRRRPVSLETDDVVRA